MLRALGLVHGDVVLPPFWSGSDPYDPVRLVDFREREEQGPSSRHVVCDIDKTYLETEFESVTRMARIAFEAATDKITVAGASDVLLAARWGERDAPPPAEGGFPRNLHFVSSSPPQLRAVLDEKLTLDGLDWTSDTFKNQAYNIRKRRIDLLRHHVGYKSLAILNLVSRAGPGARFAFIGDNAESDAFIYLGIKLLMEGRLGKDGYVRYLELAGVERGIAKTVASLHDVPPGSVVDGILIRNAPGYRMVAAPPLTDVIIVFDNFFQAALALASKEVIPAGTLKGLAFAFHNQHGLSRRALATSLANLGARAEGDLKDAVLALEARLRTTPDPAGEEGIPPGYEVDETVLARLSEAEILEVAARWTAALEKQKEKA